MSTGGGAVEGSAPAVPVPAGRNRASKANRQIARSKKDFFVLMVAFSS
jgi:hypothetical protein